MNSIVYFTDSWLSFYSWVVSPPSSNWWMPNIYDYRQKKRILLNILYNISGTWKWGAFKHDLTPVLMMCHSAFKFGCSGLASDHQGLFDEHICTCNCADTSRIVHFVPNIFAMELWNPVEFRICVMLCSCQMRWILAWDFIEQEPHKLAIYSTRFDGGEFLIQTAHRECPLIGGHPTGKPTPIESLVRNAIWINLLVNAYQVITKCNRIVLLVSSFNLCQLQSFKWSVTPPSSAGDSDVLQHVPALVSSPSFALNHRSISSSKVSATRSIRSPAGLCTMEILVRASGWWWSLDPQLYTVRTASTGAR